MVVGRDKEWVGRVAGRVGGKVADIEQVGREGTVVWVVKDMKGFEEMVRKELEREGGRAVWVVAKEGRVGKEDVRVGKRFVGGRKLVVWVKRGENVGESVRQWIEGKERGERGRGWRHWWDAWKRRRRERLQRRG